MNRTDDYKSKLENVAHFMKHPQMMPFIGKYWGNYSKLLIVAESHYLDRNKQNSELIKNWYEITSDALDHNQKEWTFTSKLFNEVKDRHYPKKGHTIFRNIEQAILDSGFKPNDTCNMFRYVSYMNFFQRPAEKTGGSINVSEEDVKIANDTLQDVVKIIQPDYIFFLSKKAWDSFEKSSFEKEKRGHSCHPTSAHWNIESTKYGNRTGKGAFIHFIQKNKIFEKENS
jgi:hypothetical protein